MRQLGQGRWLGKLLVAGLFAAAVLHTPGTDLDRSDVYGTEGNEPGLDADRLPVKKSGFFFTEYLANEVARLQSPDGTGTGGGQANQGSTAGQADPGIQANPAGQANPAVQAGQGQESQGKGSNMVVAGQGGSRGGTGPSIYGNIVTEGEKEVHPQDMILGGATLTLLRSQSDSQMLSAILQTSQGKLIVVDGGLGADGDYLRSQIQARGSHVAAWLLTHPHGDHAGALYKILQDEAAGLQSGIQIDGIYYSFAAPEWYSVNDPTEQTMAHAIIGSFSGLPEGMLNTVGRGQTIQVDDVTVQVMNDRYETSQDKGNNAGIVYKIWVNGKSILFLGDMAEEGGRRLLSEVGAEGLKSDIVQMAHHGQNGVDEEFYKAVNPSICLWPTPQWLWDSVGSRYRTSETKGWMTHLNVQRHYCTKDGDQVIR
ncbi:MBL fold metallo-hydrolase [Clostridiaceae bacterium]|nr:MBL fold metallo-hydrolase [Clostridiaceae bacterium]RKI15274.1 MBL fold metallo-hydrolase [bacterium 1XD21-70]